MLLSKHNRGYHEAKNVFLKIPNFSAVLDSQA